MRVELSREDVENMLKKFLGVETVVLNKDGSATFDTVLEKLVGEKQEPLKNIPNPNISPYPYTWTRQSYITVPKPAMQATGKK